MMWIYSLAALIFLRSSRAQSNSGKGDNKKPLVVAGGGTYDSPIFPSHDLISDLAPLTKDKKITRNLWVAVVEKDEVAAFPHVIKETENNPDWKVHLCDNADKDKFMDEYFAGTSLLWAYHNVNPVVGGAARADIWRYAVLYVHGGVYIDADSALRDPLDPLIQPEDEMIISYELNEYDGDWCYSPNSKLSTYRTSRKHPFSVTLNLFNGRNILNWCIMSSPKHIFLKRALENFVHLVRLEYIGLSALKMAKFDRFSKHVYCTTGPSLFTASCREAQIELHALKEPSSAEGDRTGGVADEKGSGAATGRRHHSSSGSKGAMKSGRHHTGPAASFQPFHDDLLSVANHTGPSSYRLAARDFTKMGGVFKAINLHKGDKTHYTRIEKHEYDFLLSYAPEEVTVAAIEEFARSPAMEGSLVMGRYQKSVYYLENGQKRQFNGMDVLLAHNFSLAQVVHLSDFVISRIPMGPAMQMPLPPTTLATDSS